MDQLSQKQTVVEFNPIGLASKSVIGELPLWDVVVTADEKIRKVTGIFDLSPDLPGVIIQGHPTYVALSRDRLYEWLSHPYGNDLFLNRPIAFLLAMNEFSSLTLSTEMRIDESVRLVLSRPPEYKYDPILVEGNNSVIKLLDFNDLLLAQTQLLAQANQHIGQQVESGRLFSQIMELPDVLYQILEHIARLIDFDQGTLVLVDPDMLHISQSSLRASINKNPSQHCADIIFDSKATNYLYHSRQPLIITRIEEAEEWLTPFNFSHVQSWIGFPLIYADKVICLISLTRLVGSNGFSRADLDLIASLSATFTSAIRNAHLHSELRILAITDPLTGIYNRRGFIETAQVVYERNLSQGNNSSVLLLDIDFFKRINDTYGHRIGDLVIRGVAQECRAQLRDVDLIGRFGGEEFVVLLPNTLISGAAIVADRLRDAVAHRAIQTGNGDVFVTVSIGISVSQVNNQALDGIIHQADSAMYQAKNLGRNRIEIWDLSGGRQDQDTAKSVNFSDLSARSQIRFSPSPKEQPLPVHQMRALDEIQTESILGWMRALEMRENGEEHHGQTAADLTVRLCRKLGFQEAELLHIYHGAILHDVGKLAVPDHILNKPGPLDEEELCIMRTHVEKGYQILMPISFLRPALAIPYCHHEKWDGSGYPRQLKGDEIPLEARLFALVDVWQALSADRCYRPAWPAPKIADYIRSESGKHFDPDLVELFIETIAKSAD